MGAALACSLFLQYIFYSNTSTIYFILCNLRFDTGKADQGELLFVCYLQVFPNAICSSPPSLSLTFNLMIQLSHSTLVFFPLLAADFLPNYLLYHKMGTTTEAFSS